MIPNSNFTDPPVVAEFLPPNNEQYYNLKQTVLGGIALDNPASGRDFQRWQVYYQQDIIHVKPENANVVFTLPIAKVLTVGLAFDATMKMVLTWTTLTGAFLYYYDTDLNEYTTKSYPGVSSSRVAPDNIESFYAEQTDIIFAYTLNGNLYYRQEREKYDIEHLIAPCEYALIKLGQSTEGRLQFQLVSPNDILGTGEIDDVPVTMSGPPPVVFVYTITPNIYTVNEGGSVIFDITTTHMPDGTILKYANSAGNALETDFVGGCIGEVIVNNNTAQFTLNVREDIATEDFETLVMSIYTESNVWLSSSHPIIINDTSISLIAKYPVKLSTLAYTLIQPAKSIFPAKLISRGYSLIQPLKAIFPVKLIVGGNSLVQSGTAIFPVKLTISAKTIIQPVTAIFPVKAAVYSIIVTPDKLTMNEGEDVTFNITTTSINDGTVMGYYIGSGTTNSSDFISDPYSNQVILLLEAEGVNGSSVFVDSSLYNNQMLAYGNAKISSLQSRSGASSLALDGNGDYVHVLSNMNMDNGDFTIDGWIYIQSLATSFIIFDSRETQNKNGFVFYVTTTAAIRAVFMSTASLSYTVTTTDNVMGGGWFHIALVKEGSSHRIYVNGNNVITFNSTANYTFTNPTAKIGLVVENDLAHSANGYIDKLRVTKGVARYNSNFNPTSLSGNFTINNNAGSFKITAVNDMLTEGTETFVMNVANSQLTNRVGYSPTITVNDTSKTTTYSITSSSTVMTENETITFTINTTNFPDNGVLNYTISVGNVGSTDFSSPITGQVTVVGNTATFNITTREDLLTEGTEIFVMSVYKVYGSWLASSPSISITDTSTVPTNTPTFTAVPKSVTVTTDKTNVNEGGSVTYIVNSTGYTTGAVLTWQILSTSTNYLDFSSGITSGTVTLNNNYGSFSVDISTDALSESPESYYVSLYGSDSLLVANSPTVTIYDVNVPTNSPSATPSYTPTTPLPTYSVVAGVTSINEGGRVNFTVSTTNVVNNTQFYFQTYANSAGLDIYDITYGSATATGAGNNFIVNNNTSTFWVDIRNDSITEGVESFGISIHSMKAWTDAGSIPGYQTPILAQTAIITVNDTSNTPTITPLIVVAPTYALSTNTNSISEGGLPLIFTITTTNVPNGTIVYWVSDYNLTPTYNTVSGSDFGLPNDLNVSTAITINNNTATFTLTAINDLLVEGTETLAITIRSTPGGALLARAPMMTIFVNDSTVTALSFGWNTSWITPNNAGILGITMSSNAVGKQFTLKLTPLGVNSVFDPTHLEWAGSYSSTDTSFYPVSTVNTYTQYFNNIFIIFRLSSAAPVMASAIGNFRIQLFDPVTNVMLASTDYSVHY